MNHKKDIATSRLDMIQIDGMRVMYANEVVYSNLIKLVQYRLQIAAHQYLPAISHVEAYITAISFYPCNFIRYDAYILFLPFQENDSWDFLTHTHHFCFQLALHVVYHYLVFNEAFHCFAKCPDNM